MKNMITPLRIVLVLLLMAFALPSIAANNSSNGNNGNNPPNTSINRPH